MKKIALITAACLTLLCASCVKDKNCRCSVLGSQEVRIITIKSGDCNKINATSWFDALDTIHPQMLVCTDYPFSGDSLVVYEK